MEHLRVYSLFLLCHLLVLVTNSSARIPCVTNLKGFGSAKHALIIGIDGLGGVHFRNVTQNFTTLHSFIHKGAYTTKARGVFPTSSAPNWASYLTGMDPMQSGIFGNSWTNFSGDPVNETTSSVPPVSGRWRPLTIFNPVKEQDRELGTAIFFTWEWIKYLVVNNSDIDEWFWGGEGITCNETGTETELDCQSKQDTNTINRTMKYIREKKPFLTFVHLNALDDAGHSSCWGCPRYYKTLSEIDKQIKRLIDTLRETPGISGKPMVDDTFVVIVSDHGGWNQNHGYGSPFIASVDIPILIRGPGVRKNLNLEKNYVSNLDVAVTVLNALGVKKNKFMRGQVLEEIYDANGSAPPLCCTGTIFPLCFIILKQISGF